MTRRTVTLPDGRSGEGGRCRSCWAPVVFVLQVKTGRTPPFNPDGTSHFANCPQAAGWRGKARKEATT